jgi:hypothetical protein
VEVKVNMDSTPEALDPIQICTELSENRPSPDSLETMKPAAFAGAVVDSSPRTDLQYLPGDTASRSPHSASIPHSTFNKVDAPFVLEEQSVYQPPPSLLPHHSPVPRTQEGTSPPIVPNSASSVFVLNFPMLARSRPPPEAAVTPPREPSPEPSCGPSIATPGTDVLVILSQILDFITAPHLDPGNTYNTTSVNITEAARGASTSAVHVSECGNQSPTQPTAVTNVRTNTWWTYLGWGGSSSDVQADPSAQNRIRMQSIGAHASSAVFDQPSTLDPTESSQPEGEIMTQVDPSSDASATERSLSDDKNPPSVQNADAARAPQDSTWYTPWSWYQSSSSAATTAAPDMNSGSQQDPPDLSQTGPNAEEKRPPGDHGAHFPPNQVSPSPQDPSATGSVDYSNPIQSVISVNPTGWMSFFTAKAIAMKSITYDKEDGKMEVMEIDDEMPPEPNSASSPVTTVTRPSPTQVTKPPVRAQPHTSDILPPSSPPPKKSDDKRSPIPHAATNPETVVNNSLKRQPSPSPSKKSGVKTPASPPLPNLVLPTWNDTFNTLPRSTMPREPPSALSKTLQYVSGVLFSRDETPSNKGKGKAKEPIHSPYDKALPRTWDVLGGGAVDVLRGCKKVVIIGVHGWFPGGSPPWMCNEVLLTRVA